jgi:hypothetical protein
MFARDKRIGPYTYVYLVENVREEGRTKQRIIANLGRKEVVVARGDLDRLARSVVRLAQRSMVLSLVEGEAPPNARCQRIGPALLFERLWHEVGGRAVLEELAAGRQFEFAAERAVFLTVLHRLFVSGSDRAAEKWRADYRIEGTEALQLHHLYRAMAWLGEPLADQAGASELTPRCRKSLPRRRPGTSWKRGCLPVGATCSPNSASSSWTPPACPSRDGAARSLVVAAIRKTTARISIR